MFGAFVMFDDEFIHIVSISFTALILTELIMVALTVRTWHWAMIAAEVLSLAIYLVSVIIFPQSFGKFKPLWLKYNFLGTIKPRFFKLLVFNLIISLLQICHLCWIGLSYGKLSLSPRYRVFHYTFLNLSGKKLLLVHIRNWANHIYLI